MTGDRIPDARSDRLWLETPSTAIERWRCSWMESFPWTRVANVRYPDEQNPMIDVERLRLLHPNQARELLGDGNFGGRYRRADEEMMALWRVAVDETRELIEGPWA